MAKPEKPEETPKGLTPSEIASPKEPGAKPANIPVAVATPEAKNPRYPGQPPEDEKYKGEYLNSEDGEIYALHIADVKDCDETLRTHHLKNTLHYWNGTEEDFRRIFTKQ